MLLLEFSFFGKGYIREAWLFVIFVINRIDQWRPERVHQKGPLDYQGM